MKKLRLVSVVLAVVLCFCCLTGCVGNISSVSINKDGSGTILVKSGFTEDGLVMIGGMGTEDIDPTELESFDYNGCKYYGTIDNYSFSNVEELTQILSTEVLNMSSGSSVKINKLNDGGFEFEILLSEEDISKTQEPDLIQVTTPEEKAAMDELMKSMAIVLDFAFPYPVIQTEGISDGISINGSHLTLDMIKMSEALSNKPVSKIKFISSPNGAISIPEPEIARIVFSDVPQNMWYFVAIDNLANGGLIQGMGNGIFMPEGTLTYAQFCQILAKAKGLETGDANNYWAYKAIDSCLKTGYVDNIGIIQSSIYDTPIPREVAIAAMYRAKANTLTTVVNANVSVPDIEDCNITLKDDVLKAYKYGITQGVDANGTFLPRKSLTRAEVCQLFYNLNWLVPEK